MTSRTPCLAGLRPLSCSCSLTIWVASANRLAKLRTPRTYCFNAGFSGLPNGVTPQPGSAASGTVHNTGVIILQRLAQYPVLGYLCQLANIAYVNVYVSHSSIILANGLTVVLRCRPPSPAHGRAGWQLPCFGARPALRPTRAFSARNRGSPITAPGGAPSAPSGEAPRSPRRPARAENVYRRCRARCRLDTASD